MTTPKLPILGAMLGFACLPAYAQGTAAVSADSVYEAQAVTVPPRPLNVPEFAAALRERYPSGLEHGGVTPSVYVRFIVDSAGTAREFRVLESTDSVLHAPALAALSVLRFAPAEIDGRPVHVWADLPIQWQLPAPAPARVEPRAALPGDTSRIVARGPVIRNVSSLRHAMMREYPEWLKNAMTGGTVVVRMRVSPEGTPGQTAITSSTHSGFNAASLRAVRVLRFRPAALDDRPVAVWVELPLQWEPWPAPPGGVPPR